MAENATAAEVEPGEERIEITDLLINMFFQQMQHKKAYDEIYRQRGLDPVAPGGWGNLSDPRLQLEIRTTVAYFLEELFEAMNLLKNKPWKQTARATDPDAFYEEMADAWHFWLELMILCGMTPEIIAKHYFKKSAVNDTRRETGY